jgi:hypothetical protein
MKPAAFSQSWATVAGFWPSTLTFLFRSVSVAVSSFAAIGVKTCSSYGYFCATAVATEMAGL